MLNRQLNKSFSGFNYSLQYNVVYLFLYTFLFPAQSKRVVGGYFYFCGVFSLFVITGAVLALWSLTSRVFEFLAYEYPGTQSPAQFYKTL